MHTAAEINAAIAQGHTVTATAADLKRPGQPNRGQTVTLTQAFDGYGEIRATARGFKGRFRVTDVRLPAHLEHDTTPDTY